MVLLRTIRLVFSILLLPVSFGCGIAAIVLFKESFQIREQFAEDPAFVFVSFFGTFGPLEVISSTPLIDDNWETLRRAVYITRLHNAVLILDMITAALYAIVQGTADEYNNIAMAVVVLIFSMYKFYSLNLFYLQLRAFRIWALKSIETLLQNDIHIVIDKTSISRESDLCYFVSRYIES